MSYRTGNKSALTCEDYQEKVVSMQRVRSMKEPALTVKLRLRRSDDHRYSETSYKISAGRPPATGILNLFSARLPSKGICKRVERDLRPRRRYPGSFVVSHTLEVEASEDILISRWEDDSRTFTPTVV